MPAVKRRVLQVKSRRRLLKEIQTTGPSAGSVSLHGLLISDPNKKPSKSASPSHLQSGGELQPVSDDSHEAHNRARLKNLLNNSGK